MVGQRVEVATSWLVWPVTFAVLPFGHDPRNRLTRIPRGVETPSTRSVHNTIMEATK